MSFRYVILIFLVTLFAYLLKTHLSCIDYNGNFHYFSQVVSFHLNELTSSDRQVPIFIVRFFHNKVSVLLFDIFNRYIQFFTVFYLINILSFVGLFGLFYFYFSFFAQRIENKWTKIFAVILLLLPFLEIFQLMKQAFIIKIFYLILPYQVAAYIGIFLFLKQKKHISYGICFLLLLLSIGWIIVFRHESLSFCTTS